MSEWRKVKLGEISKCIQTGPFGSQLHQSDYSDCGIPVVMPKDIINGHIDETTIAHVEQHHVDRLYRHKISKGDILYARRGDVGKCAFAVENQEGWLCGTGCLRVTINKELAYPKFVFFQLQKREIIGWVEKHAIGATMLNLNTSILSEVPIELPSLNTQKQVVDILSRYDSLIENYQKQIKLLEEAAQRLYKEWFVDLHFPGHEKTKIVDGVPEGWERKTVEDSLNQHMNGGWGKDSSISSNVIEAPVLRGTDIEKIKSGVFNDLPIRYHTEKDITNKHLEANDIILELSNGNFNNVGRTLRIDDSIIKQCGENLICASFCKFLRPIDHCSSIILSLEFQDMQNGGRMKKYKKNGANGINNFDFQGFLKHELLFPCSSLSIRKLDIILKNISNYRVQISFLTEARDRLLPKLMSGEIAV